MNSSSTYEGDALDTHGEEDRLKPESCERKRRLTSGMAGPDHDRIICLFNIM